MVVVEPQDVRSYKDAGVQNLLILPADNQGIAYVRNWILQFALEAGLPRYWMLDDDIKGFVEYVGVKGLRLGGEEALAKAEKQLIWSVPNIGQGALEYTQFAWSQRKEVVWPGYCDVAVLMFPEKINKFGLRYREEMNLKEDRDFTLQVLASGMLTARTGKIAFVAPKNGSNSGGLSNVYSQNGREALASQRMVEAWPGVCESNVKMDGRPDVKIHWKIAINYYKSRRP